MRQHNNEQSNDHDTMSQTRERENKRKKGGQNDAISNFRCCPDYVCVLLLLLLLPTKKVCKKCIKTSKTNKKSEKKLLQVINFSRKEVSMNSIINFTATYRPSTAYFSYAKVKVLAVIRKKSCLAPSI